jgi:predicted kinase
MIKSLPQHQKKERRMYKKILGLVRLFFHLLSKNCRKTINEIVDTLTANQSVIKQKIFVMMVGYSKTGKTSSIKDDVRLNKFFKLSSDDIHDLLNSKLSFLKDDNTINGKAYWERQYLTKIIRKKALEKAFSKGLAIVSDSANLVRKKRSLWLKMAKKHSYETVIIWVFCPEKELLSRLKKYDDDLISKGESATWVNLYNNIQKEIFDLPLPSEADSIKILICSNGRKKYLTFHYPPRLIA